MAYNESPPPLSVSAVLNLLDMDPTSTAGTRLKTRIAEGLKRIDHLVQSVNESVHSTSGLTLPLEITDDDDESEANEKIQSTLNYYYRLLKPTGPGWILAAQDHLIGVLRTELKLGETQTSPEVQFIQHLISLSALLGNHGNRNPSGNKFTQAITVPRKRPDRLSAELSDPRGNNPSSKNVGKLLNPCYKEPEEIRKRGRPRKTREIDNKIRVTHSYDLRERKPPVTKPRYDPISLKRPRKTNLIVKQEYRGVTLKDEVKREFPSASPDVKNPCYEPIRRKRGRPRKNNLQVKQETQPKDEVKREFPSISGAEKNPQRWDIGGSSCKNPCYDEPIRRKRGRPRKNNVVVKQEIQPKDGVKREFPSTSPAENNSQRVDIDVSSGTNPRYDQPIRRKRGRPRKSSVVVRHEYPGVQPKNEVKREFPSSSPAEKNIQRANIDGSSCRNPCYDEPIRRKRGRPRKNSVVVKQETQLQNGVKREFPSTSPVEKNAQRVNIDVSCRNPCYSEPTRRKRGRPRRINLKVKQEYPANKTRTKKIDSENAFKKALLIHDPMSGNVYYRALLFVRLSDVRCFQCSTCSELIPFTNTQHDRFHAHHLVSHSDCFQCKYCVMGSRLTSVQELHHHMALFHGVYESSKPQRRRPKSNNDKKVSEPRVNNHKFKSVCPICGMPAPYSTQSLEYEQHYYTHLNKEEKRTLARKAGPLDPAPKKKRPYRKRKRETLPSFQKTKIKTEDP